MRRVLLSSLAVAALLVVAAAKASNLRAHHRLLMRAAGVVASNEPTNVTCQDCIGAVGYLASIIREDGVEDVVQEIAEEVCLLGKGGFGWSCDGDWACHDLCHGITERFTPIVADVLSRSVDPRDICEELKLCPVPPQQPASPIRLAEPQESVPSSAASSTDDGLLRIVHISDLHWDPNSTVGARTDCGEPDCCRRQQGMAENASMACGYYGDHAGDAPTALVQSMLEFAATLSPDLIFQTGDVPPHMVWNVTAEDVKDLNLRFHTMIHDSIPGVPVAMCAGNHGGEIIDQFNLTSFGPGSTGTTRLWQPLANLAEQFGWLDATARQQLSYAGYYSWRVPNLTMPGGGGLVLLAMHPGLHQSGNWYTKVDKSVDLAGEATFMQQVIEQAAAAGDKVWILTHHPLNDGGYADDFLEGFLAPLIAAHPGTVLHAFSGHTHKAQTQILWRNSTGGVLEPIATSYVVAAPTPYNGVNPTFRLLLVNRTTLAVERYTDYTVDLSLHKNQLTPEPKPTWAPRCIAPDHFNMTGLTPDDWHAFARRVATEDAAFRTWELCYRTSNAATADYSASEREARVCDLLGGTKALVKACHAGRINATAPVQA